MGFVLLFLVAVGFGIDTYSHANRSKNMTDANSHSFQTSDGELEQQQTLKQPLAVIEPQTIQSDLPTASTNIKDTD